MTLHAPFPTEKTRMPARRPITLVRLLTWAYRTQMVQYEVDRHAGAACAPFLPAERSGLEAGRGCINGAGTTAHDDAHVVHAHVCRLRGPSRWLLISHGAMGHPPEWAPSIPPLRVVPVRKAGSGRIRERMWDGSRNAVAACPIRIEGVDDARAALLRDMARMTYLDWWLALREVRISLASGDYLQRWRVSGIGAEMEPWNMPWNRAA